jgi:phosphoglycerate dehydrogenase-like enzyme
MLLALARKLTVLDAACKAGEWPRGLSADVTGQTLGLVGTGRIGTAVARRARAFGMDLLGCDPFPTDAFRELGGRYVSLDELLERSNFVSLHSPATPETRHLISEPQLARMKPTAFLLNCARGSIIDEAALLRALEEGRIAGAGLDVLSVEPPLPDSPACALMQHPAVIATPHVASFTPRTAARMANAAMDNMLTVLRGERPASIANPAVYERGIRAG